MIAARARALLGLESLVPELRNGQERFFRLAAQLRIALGLTAGVALVAHMVAADRSPARVAVAVALAAPNVPLLWWSYRRLGLLHPALAVWDCLVLGALAVIEPHFLSLAGLFALATVVYTAFTTQRATGLAVSFVAASSIFAAASITAVHDWWIFAVTFPIVAFTVNRTANAIAGTAAAALETNERIARELGMILWEAPPGPGPLSHLRGDTLGLYGWPVEHYLRDGGWEADIHPDDAHVGPHMDAELAAGRDYRVRYRLRHADGSYRWLEEVGLVQRDGDGAVTGSRGFTFDVTQQMAAAARVVQLDSVVDALGVAIVVYHLVDRDDPTSLTIVRANPAADRMSLAPFAVGSRLIDVAPATFDLRRRRGVGYLMADVARGGPEVVVRDARTTDRQGAARVVSLRMAALPGDHVAVVGEDVTDLYEAHARLERQAYVDELTGLPNRARMREAIAASPPGTLVALCGLDLFQHVNDAFGHEHGDRLLVDVARALGEAVDGALVARFGGDEFGFVVPPGAGTAEDVGRAIQAAFSRPFELRPGLTLHSSASIGITVRTDAATAADELVRQADVAMYRAKRARGSVEVYRPSGDTSTPHRLLLLGEVRRAVRGHELELHYQPVVACRTGEVVRLEGLLRWRHPALGLLPPSEFIELTELHNLNAEVVLHTLRTAIADARRLRDAGIGLPVSINVAGRTLHDPQLIDRVVEAVSAAGLDRHAIGIELTERQLLLGDGSSIESLERLRDAGLWLSIDDFGAGSSSLAALRRVPAHELKIDQQFVDDLRRGDTSLIGSIVAMAHGIGLVVVAEGVEDEVTWRWLRDHGADQAQGFWFAHPAPLAAVEARLLAGEAGGGWRIAR